VDAAYKAIDMIANIPSKLMEYTVQAVTGGIDALGEVTIRIQEDGKTYVGHGADMDIIVASVKAYLTALNKVMANKPALADASSIPGPAKPAEHQRTSKSSRVPNLGPTPPVGSAFSQQS